MESRDGRALYYSQTRNQGPLYRMPLDTGEPELVAPELRGLFFPVADDGVYYQSRRRIWFWSEKTKQAREVFKPLQPLGLGIALSPDGRELLFIQSESQQTDLYWIETR